MSKSTNHNAATSTKESRAAYMREYRTNHPEYRAARAAFMRSWRKVHPDAPRVGRYGMTPGEYSDLLAAQRGLCAICQRPETSRAGAYRLSVDHDHETGRIRGLLCDKCNRGLGLFQEDPSRLRAAAEYVARAGASVEDLL